MESKEEYEKLLDEKPKPTGFISGIMGNITKTVGNYTARTTQKVYDRVKKKIFGQFSYEEMKKIKNDFVATTMIARKNQVVDANLVEKFGTMPTVVLPIAHIMGAASAIKDTNGMFTGLQFVDNSMRGVSASAGVVAGVSLATGASIALPPLLCIPLVICLASFLQFQKEKNNELLYACELIFSMCQDMLPDLIRMYKFYDIINDKGNPNDNKKVNPFIPKTIKKITDLQVYIITVCEPIVIQFMALSFGIIDSFEEKFDGKNVDKLKKIFGEKGYNDECYKYDFDRTNETKKTDDDCDGNSSQRSYASVKRAIIHRLTNTSLTRNATNYFASGEKYRQAIRDITIVGILFSQASARFSLDAIDHVVELQTATDQFNQTQDKSTVDGLNKVAAKLTDVVVNTNPDPDPDQVSTSGGRRRKRTRKYRR